MAPVPFMILNWKSTCRSARGPLRRIGWTWRSPIAAIMTVHIAIMRVNGTSPNWPRSNGSRFLINSGNWAYHTSFSPAAKSTLRNDLPELIAHAETNGQITGLNTNARRLADEKYLRQLIDAGLDHVQITVESCDEQIHDQMVQAKGAFKQTIHGLKNALASPLYVMTNTTMLKTNVHKIPDTLDFLVELGVPTIGLNALIYSGHALTVGTGLKENELQPILDMATRKTSEHGQKLIWYTPTQYCEFDPTANNLGVKGCTAALYSMCIESNGNVLPCQSYYHALGNMLTNSSGLDLESSAVGAVA